MIKSRRFKRFKRKGAVYKGKNKLIGHHPAQSRLKKDINNKVDRRFPEEALERGSLESQDVEYYKGIATVRGMPLEDDLYPKNHNDLSSRNVEFNLAKSGQEMIEVVFEATGGVGVYGEYDQVSNHVKNSMPSLSAEYWDQLKSSLI